MHDFPFSFLAFPHIDHRRYLLFKVIDVNCQKLGHAYGCIWQTIHQLSSRLYQLILSIKSAVWGCFTANKEAPSPDPNLTASQIRKEPSEEIGDPLAFLGTLFPSPSNHVKSFTANEEAPPLRKKLSEEIENPLAFLGSLFPSPSNHVKSFTANEEAPPLRKKLSEEIEDPLAFLGSLFQSPSNHVKSFTADKEAPPLRKKLSEEIEDPLDSMANLFRLPSNLVGSSKKVLDTAISFPIKGVLRQAGNLLEEIATRQLTTLQDYLDLTEQLEQARESLKSYKSDEVGKDVYQFIDSMREALENKTTAVEKEMCIYVSNWYKPNPKIADDGNCLFLSIQHQLNSPQDQKYFRQLAANFIRHHFARFEIGGASFEVGMIDAMMRPGAKESIARYEESQGGKENWKNKLQKGLGREPTQIDFYCDCLENYNFWGGINEISALSKKLQTPILVFAPDSQDFKAWKLRVVEKEGKAKPILLFYNGVNHYQDLIPK